MTIQTVSRNRSHGGIQGVYKHASRETGTDMTFSVYVPPHQEGAKLPVVWYLSGLTCTHANVTEKGEFRGACAELGLIMVAPDTSPRGENVAGDPAKSWDFGLGAGFYVDATEAPFAQNYRMWSYVTEELPELVAEHFPIDRKRQSVFGHSISGHASDNAAGQCQARCPGRLLEAMCEHGPRGMAVTYRLRKQAVPYRTRLTGWLIRSNEGFGANTPDPSPFQAAIFSSNPISASGAVTFGAWLASIS